MSFLPSGITIIQAALSDLLSPVLFMSRNVGGFIADVTLKEKHTDEIEITDHPVERGAPITDHAFKRQAEVSIEVGYSNSGPNGFGNPFYVQLVYDQFLNLQASLEPFSITTGKRVYDNMLIKRLYTETDEKTENALILEIDCREIIIVDTQTVSAGSSTSNPSQMVDPVNNAGTTNRGAIQSMPLPDLSVPPNSVVLSR